MKQWLKGAAVIATGFVMVVSPALAGPKPAAPPAPPVHSAPSPQMNPLGLTPAQQQKLQALSQKMRPDIMAALKKAKTGQEANKAMVAVQAKWNPQIMAILTPAQRAKFKTLRAQALKANAAAAARVKALPKK